MAYNPYDIENIPNIKKQFTSSSPLKRSILADNTNTSELLALPRKRTHFASTSPEQPPSTDSHTPPETTPLATNKRSKPEPQPVEAAPSKSSFLSSIKNTLSIFSNWNPIKGSTRDPPANNQTRPLHTPTRSMHALVDPLGASHCVTGGPTIKPWAVSHLKREQDELSSVLSTSQRESISRNVFATRNNKTIFKNQIFARSQQQRYEDLLVSKSIPTDILSTSTAHIPPSSRHNSTLLENSNPPPSDRLSSSLQDPPPLPKPTPISFSYSRGYRSEHSLRSASRGYNTSSFIKPKPSKPAPSNSKGTSNHSLFNFPSNPIDISTQSTTSRCRTPPAKHAPLTEQDDICIVSVSSKPHPHPPLCILSFSEPLMHPSDNYIGSIKHNFDLSRIKKEFEEEELNAYNRKMALAHLERSIHTAPTTAKYRTKSYCRGNTSIQELNEKMEKLVNTVEIDIGDSGMPGAGFKPVELGEEMENLVSNALIPSPQGEVLSSGFRLHIKRKDMSTLQPEQWLNDEIINFYCSMLADRSQQTGAKQQLPKVHTFNTFFYPQLKDRGYDSIKRWTRKIDIFTFDIITVPIHLGMHWCMTLIDLRNKTITYYDSFLGNNDRCLNNLFGYLKRERLDKKGEDFDSTGWRLVHEKDIPEQRNSSDCGVFACQFAEFLTRDSSISFTQDDMLVIRRQMVAEILQKKLYH